MRVTSYVCFGWGIQYVQLADGEQFPVIARTNIPRDKMSTKTFYTLGYLSAAHEVDGTYTPDRPAGFFSPTDLPDVVARGKNVLTAVGDSAWWCLDVNLPMNKGRAPTLTALTLEQGQTRVLPVGTNLLVCEGVATVAGTTFDKARAFTVAGEEKVLTADSKFLGLIFDATNPAG